MPKFEVKLEIDGWLATAQELADSIILLVPRKLYSPHNVQLSLTSIEVTEVGHKIKRGETYYRR